jgi:hypothetical protein
MQLSVIVANIELNLHAQGESSPGPLAATAWVFA